MSWFLARIYDGFMRKSEDACLSAWRRELLAGAHGDVLELGAGTGANLLHYPAAVRHLVLVEPDPHMGTRLEARLRDTSLPFPTELITAQAALPFAAASFDTAVVTLVLCSVAEPAATLDELYRVLRPGGTLLFLEHVAAEDHPQRRAWQARLEPLWKHISGNCHLTRRTADAIRAAGFVVESETRESMRKALPWLRPTVRGVARRPA